MGKKERKRSVYLVPFRKLRCEGSFPRRRSPHAVAKTDIDMTFITGNGLKRRRQYDFVVTLALILGLALSQKIVEDRDFTIDEFYDIKKSVKSLQLKKASYVLEHERVKTKKLHRSLPKAPRFYGQDHFEQSYDRTGKEIWTHVGRPVRRADMIHRSFRIHS